MPEQGITMVLDKGLGIRELEDLLEVAGTYFHFLKLGFGTAALYPPEILRRKVELGHSHGIKVYPGGTWLEIELARGKSLEQALRTLSQWGFSTLEISEGTVSYEARTRRRLIRLASEAGFTVLSEVGKKNPCYPFDPPAIAQQIEADLEAGAQWVIVEGREQGKGVGIYDAEGGIKEHHFSRLLDLVADPQRLIWEAPLPTQQLALIRRLGPYVHLGNILPEEVLALAALRRGLRSDTFFWLEKWRNQVVTSAARAELG
ncbi:phosphosulfolactate synthase [Desulfothermobacter acidiphilus]|uniref:phosphosulfolactate synthase n=1 Tax=Desulfothermobacter acidiphilus TaxID=1938353 RepID=UPI003F8A21BD